MQATRTHRFAAFALAAVMTLAMLAGVDGLATHEATTADQMAHVATQPQA